MPAFVPSFARAFALAFALAFATVTPQLPEPFVHVLPQLDEPQPVPLPSAPLIRVLAELALLSVPLAYEPLQQPFAASLQLVASTGPASGPAFAPAAVTASFAAGPSYVPPFA